MDFWLGNRTSQIRLCSCAMDLGRQQKIFKNSFWTLGGVVCRFRQFFRCKPMAPVRPNDLNGLKWSPWVVLGPGKIRNLATSCKKSYGPSNIIWNYMILYAINILKPFLVAINVTLNLVNINICVICVIPLPFMVHHRFKIETRFFSSERNWTKGALQSKMKWSIDIRWNRKEVRIAIAIEKTSDLGIFLIQIAIEKIVKTACMIATACIETMIYQRISKIGTEKDIWPWFQQLNFRLISIYLSSKTKSVKNKNFSSSWNSSKKRSRSIPDRSPFGIEKISFRSPSALAIAFKLIITRQQLYLWTIESMDHYGPLWTTMDHYGP